MVGPVDPAGGASPAPRVLVGRERERALLRAQIDAALAGRGSLVLIGGEAGIGKTTLVEDLALQAEEQGALVLWGHAYDLSVTPPYGPWIGIARRYQATGREPPFLAFLDDPQALAALGGGAWETAPGGSLRGPSFVTSFGGVSACGRGR